MTLYDIGRLKQAVSSYLVALTLGDILAFGFVYLCCQQAIRYQRERSLIQRYRKSTEGERSGKTKAVESVQQSGQGVHSPDDGRQGLDLSRMSFVQAGAIQRELLALEFPSTFRNSLRLAFFQVCCFFQLISVPMTIY